MGMFNTIYTDIRCPVTNKMSDKTGIQIKCQQSEARQLNVYHVNDSIEDLSEGFNNTWIKTDYICNACSTSSVKNDKLRHIKTEDQKRHFVFIRVEDSIIKEIMTEKEFLAKKQRETYLEDL